MRCLFVGHLLQQMVNGTPAELVFCRYPRRPTYALRGMFECSFISSFASAYASHRNGAIVGPSGTVLHRLIGSCIGINKPRCCSSSLIENQDGTSLMPERTKHILSNSGTSSAKFSIYLLGRRDLITRSTPAHLYQVAGSHRDHLAAYL